MSVEELSDCLGYRADFLEESLSSSVDPAILKDDHGVWVYTKALFEEVTTELSRRLHEHHEHRPQDQGPSSAELREQLSEKAPGSIFEAVVQDLIETNIIKRVGPHLAMHEHTAILPNHMKDCANALLSLIRNAGLGAPFLKDLTSQSGSSSEEVKEALSFLVRAGDLVRISAEYFVTSSVHTEFVLKIQSHLKEIGTLTIDDTRQITGLSRKYLVPLLTDLDGRNITRRSSKDARVAHTNVDYATE
jgi:selenocysteine-specific elongation factor